ncbi:phosphatase PAP2 family protein [Brucella sp. IR073]|uniref:phosphatase PAP2 family protein n=1 Tax=unclassified Brucella TaxID=2632610 RepID=UPI003B97E937
MRETTFRLYDRQHWNETAPATAWLGLTILVVSFVFILFPGLDLAATRLIADGALFPLADSPLLQALRDFNRAVIWWLLPLMSLAVLAYALLPRRVAFLAPHKALFVISSFAVGPGLLVQAAKSLIGRPRPTGIVEFGGTAAFSPVWQFAGFCSRNCSFPSGEAALAAAALSVLVFVPVALRRSVGIAFTPFLLVVALNRVLFGAHFLSDVLIAWFGTLWAMAWLWSRIAAGAGRIDGVIRRAGLPIRRAIFGLWAD